MKEKGQYCHFGEGVGQQRWSSRQSGGRIIGSPRGVWGKLPCIYGTLNRSCRRIAMLHQGYDLSRRRPRYCARDPKGNVNIKTWKHDRCHGGGLTSCPSRVRGTSASSRSRMAFAEIWPDISVKKQWMERLVGESEETLYAQEGSWEETDQRIELVTY